MMSTVTSPSRLLLHCMSAILLLASFTVIFLFYPVLYCYLLTEDSWLEYGTFALFFVASILMALTIAQNPQYRKPGYLLFFAFLVFVAGEEISWGERLHGIHAPQVLISQNLQHESNLHNLPFFQDLIVITFILMVITWGIVLPLLNEKTSRLRSLCSRFGVPVPARHHMPYFVLTLFILINPGFVYRRELAEPIFGLCILMTALHITSRADILITSLNGRWTTPAFAWALTLALTVVLSLGFPNPSNFKYRINYFAAKGYPQRNLDTQADQLMDYILAHPELIRDTSLTE